ncbi:MAG TPA: DegQ family serine endoprotease [Methylomirabilota bacterium]|jgi:serine protease Do|nr:DegQ family serine endoprotease [Methylomirabilota bacterium]
MRSAKRWRVGASLGALAILVAGCLMAVAPSGSAAPPAAGAAPTGRAIAQAATPGAGGTGESAQVGALPESYPWVRLAEQVMPAVVNVRTSGESRRSRGPQLPEPFRRFMPQPPEGGGGEMRRGVGSGFIIDPGGFIVTNHHVVEGAKTVEVTLADGRSFQARVVGSDSETDLALLKIEAAGLPTIPLGSSASLKVAEPVMAIGNPFGLDHTVTVGIVSATGRFIGQGRFDDFIQTDAAINPGNSGGPLINTRGEAVGINSAIFSRGGGFQGIGFAIPVDLAKPVLTQLQASGKVTRGWLGVAIQPLTAELAKSFGMSNTQGALVASVTDDSPAAKAGLKPGDVIVGYDGKPVDSPRVLPGLVANTPVGRAVPVVIMRDGAKRTVTVNVGNLADAREARGPAPERTEPASRTSERLGLALSELTPEVAQRFGIQGEKGVVVTGVKPDSPAAQAGLAPGDLIREVNRVPVQGLDDVERGIARGSGADQVLLRVEREGSQRYVVIATG